MNSTLIVGDLFEDIIDVVVYCSHSIELFFCSGRGEFIVVIKVYSVLIEAIGTTT